MNYLKWIGWGLCINPRQNLYIPTEEHLTLEITQSFSGKIKTMGRNIAIFLVGLLAVLSTYIISWRRGTHVVDKLLVEYDYIVGKF